MNTIDWPLKSVHLPNDALFFFLKVIKPFRESRSAWFKNKIIKEISDYLTVSKDK